MYTDVHTQYLCSRKPNLNVLSHSFTGKRISATTAEIFGVHLAERHMYVHDNYLAESLLHRFFFVHLIDVEPALLVLK